MRKIKKIPVFLLALVLCIGMMAIPAFAASSTQDGIQVTLAADKESYSQGEQITAVLTVTNTNETAVSNVSLENVIPEGYELADGSEATKQVESLKAGETVTLTAVYTAEDAGVKETDQESDSSAESDTDTEKQPVTGGPSDNTGAGNTAGDNTGNGSGPKTGDNAHIAFWTALLILACAAIVTIIAVKKKSGKKLLSLLLCAAMAGSLAAGFPADKVSAEENNSGSISVEDTVTVDGEALTLKGIVTYSKTSTEPDGDSMIKLSASKTEYSLSEDGTIYFYAEVDGEATSVVLVDAETEEVLLELVDDGKYSESGDDLPGDNIYTGKDEIDTSFENEYSFYAVASGKEKLVSNTVKVIVFSNFTDEQLTDMEKVDETIQTELFSAENYNSMSVAERKEIADALFEKLVAEGLIKSGSVFYDAEAQTYTYVYSAGAVGSLIIKNWNSEQNGAEESTNFSNEISDTAVSDILVEETADSPEDTNESETASDEETAAQTAGNTNTPDEETAAESSAETVTEETAEETVETVTEEDASNERNGAVDENALEENAIMPYADEEEDFTVGKALILWSFNQTWDDASYRKPFYASTESDWEANGLDTTVNYNSTVEDYKKLEGYDVIVFSGHGEYHTYPQAVTGTSEQTLSSLLLHETVTKSKASDYSADLKGMRIGRMNVQGGTMFAILPNFFTYYYGGGELDGSFVYAENCEFYGKSGNVDSAMANAIISTSAESVIGFHNSVMATYSRELMKDYVDSLIDGSTTKEAYNSATESQGANDYFSGREQYGPTAYPIFTGNENSSLINTDIKNGDFEQASMPAEWSQVGDTRVINKLGDLVPHSNQRMAILTTGIGSAEKDYLSGTEGSVLSQMVKIPEDKTSLVFSYDFVSEEPSEFVGTIYNDTFAVQIISDSGTETILKNDVNSAEWHEIDGIDFDGGDFTTYHTQWRNVTCDLSKYSGQVVSIRFMVYDKGDSIYDSAVLLDGVSLK